MGYKAPRKSWLLKFEDPDFDGLEVMIRSAPVSDFLALAGLSAAGEDNAAALGLTERALEILARCLVSWNLEDDDDVPVPATLDGIRSQDLSFVIAIITAWTEALGGVPSPLPPGSPDGVTPPASPQALAERSLGLASSSSSPAS